MHVHSNMAGRPPLWELCWSQHDGCTLTEALQPWQGVPPSCRQLLVEGVSVEVIHGDQPAAAREAAVQQVRCGQLGLLIATDLVGRGE